MSENQVIPEAVVRPQVFNRSYRYPWHDGWAVRLPKQFDKPFPTYAAAIEFADRVTRG